MKIKHLPLILIAYIFFCRIIFAQADRGVTVMKTDANGAKVESQLYQGNYALIIGNSEYSQGWQRLSGVKSDVPAIRGILEKHGFKVETEENLTSENFEARIKRFINDYGYDRDNRLIIYYAGHGATLSSAGDNRDIGYIIPVDAPLPNSDPRGFRQKAVSMISIQSFARQIQAKHALFVFDSCFSGKIFALRDAPKVTPFIYEKIDNPVRQFITAGNETQTVSDESYFRKAFVRGLEGEADKNNDGYIVGTELAEYLKEAVTNYSNRRQTPQFGTINDIDLDRGDFVFMLPNKNPSAQKSSNPDSPAEPSKPVDRSAIEGQFWEAIKNSSDAEDFKLYKQKFPNGIYESLADIKIKMLGSAQPVIRKYSQMNESEKFAFISGEANRVVGLLGEKSANSISPEGLSLIRKSIQDYLDNTKPDAEISCQTGELSQNLSVILKCGEKVAPDINKIFAGKGIAPQVGLYIAMSETGFKTCYHSETGPLGMFPFVYASAKNFFAASDNIVTGATPEEPDDRCDYAKSTNAAANNIQAINVYFGRRINSSQTDWLLVVSAWNSGEGSLGRNVDLTKTSFRKTKVTFWDLLQNKNNLGLQFQEENLFMVTKFIASAIIGENPRAFGIDMEPLSSMTK